MLLIEIIAALFWATMAILRDRDRRVALVAVVSAGLAVLLGGATVHFDPIESTPVFAGPGLVRNRTVLFRLVFIPIEKVMGVRALSPLWPGWRTDLAYFFLSHVLVRFILIAVTASASTVASFNHVCGESGFRRRWAADHRRRRDTRVVKAGKPSARSTRACSSVTTPP